ncbi:NUDIX hydrolase [Microlunatus elymi]|uniref:NUDIX hydrolase n=1 Tax=Microlunatus elymi TaxID=2596828 RepID=A0A516PZ41_9ACTN|nr:NUDIX hydrolase [Microlunatus elymi]QDP96443.1 NUDIX hydrolase [Microlunatus elymi]
MHFSDYDTRLAAYAVIVDDSTGTDRILLSWFNGGRNGRARQCWSLPGGGVEYEESIEQAIVREAKEETGYDVELGLPLTTSTFTTRDPGRRPYKAVRILYTAAVTGGTVGTLEVGGTTDRADWLPIDKVVDEPHADIVAIGIDAWQQLAR